MTTVTHNGSIHTHRAVTRSVWVLMRSSYYRTYHGHDLAPPSAARHAGKGRLLPHGPRVTLVAFVIALLAAQ
jgi:hypothetical protein